MATSGPDGGGGGHASPQPPDPQGSPTDAMEVIQTSNSPDLAENSVATPTLARGTGRALLGPMNRHSVTKARRQPESKSSVGSVGKHLQTIAGSIEKQLDKQSLAQLGATRGDLESLWRQVQTMVNELTTTQDQRIASLEQEVKDLRKALKSQEPNPVPPAPAILKPVTYTTSTPSRRLHEPATPGAITETNAPRQEKKVQTSYASVAMTAASKNQQWQTVPVKSKKPSASPNKASDPMRTPKKPSELSPARERNKEARRLLFRREEGSSAPEAEREEIILAINRALAKKGFPSFVRAVDAGYTKSGALSVLLERGSLGSMLVPYYRDLLVATCRQVDSSVIAVELPEQWYRIKVHGVPMRRYLHLGLGLAREEIELGTEYKLMRDPMWLRNPQKLQGKNSTIVITVGSYDELRKILANGIRFGGSRYLTGLYWELGAEAVCPRCCGIGHRSFMACGDRPVCCFICAGTHQGSEHVCKVVDCPSKPGTACQHTPVKCGNCGGHHPATAGTCPKIREARKRFSKQYIENGGEARPSSPSLAAVIPSQRALEKAPARATEQPDIDLCSDAGQSIPDTDMEEEIPLHGQATTSTLC
jgi:hypothetical protein